METQSSTQKQSRSETEKAIEILGLCALYLLFIVLKEYYAQALLISLISCALYTLITFLKGNDIASSTTTPAEINLARITKATGPLTCKRPPKAGCLYCALKFRYGSRTAHVNMGCSIEDPPASFKKLIDTNHLPQDASWMTF